MNSIEQEIKVIDALIKEYERDIQKLHKNIFDLSGQRDQLLVQLVRKNKLLQGTKWRFPSGIGYWDDVSLRPYGLGLSDQLKKLGEMLRSDYHCQVELQEGIFLRFDDNDLSLVFQSNSLVLPFVKEHEIVVITLDIRDKIDHMKQDISAMEEVLKMVGATNE